MDRVRKLEKGRRYFPAELLFFCVLGFSRFFDHKIISHPVPFDFLENYGVALAEMFVYLALFLGVCALAMRRASSERDMGNLCTFLAVFLVPFFLHKNYFGTFDMLLMLLVLAGMPAVMAGKEQGKTIGLVCFMAVMILSAIWLGFVEKDVQEILSLKKFLLLILLFSPYLCVGAHFLFSLCREAKKQNDRQYVRCVLYACAGCVPAILWTAAGDYSRAVFYGFVCYLVPAVCFAAQGDGFFAARLKEEKEAVKKVLPLPEIFVAYPLIFIIFWITGWESIPVEEILKLQ